MKLVFHKATCVTVGAFNMYIIQPAWMARKGLFANDAEVSIESKLDEPGFRYQMEGSGLRWVVTPTRIIVETEDESQDCGFPIAQLLRLLPETPVSAVGNTSVFGVEGLVPPPVISSEEQLRGYNVKERNLHIAIEVEKTIYNLGLRWKSAGTELLVNGLRPISNGETSATAVQHAGDFMVHRRTGVELATRVFGV